MPYLVCDYCGYLETERRTDCINCGKPLDQKTSFDSLTAALDYQAAVRDYHKED